MKIRSLILVLGLNSSAPAALEFIVLQNANLGSGDFPYTMTPDGNLLAGQSGGVAAVWNAQGQVTAKGPGAILDVSADGGVFVGQTEDFRPAIWKNGLNAVPILATGEQGIAYTVTADGLHSAGRSDSYAVKFNHLLQNQTIIAFPSNWSSDVYKMTPDGNTMVGEWGSADGYSHGFLKVDQNEYEVVGALGDSGFPDYTAAYSVSDDDKVVVGVSRGEAFRWTRASGIVGLGPNDLSGGYRLASVSGDGRTIVGNSDHSDTEIVGGFVWDERNGLRDLKAVIESGGVDLSGWFFYTVSAISFDGDTIAGEGTLQVQGVDTQRGWVVRGFSQFLPPTISIGKEGNQYVVKFTGVLQESDDLGILDLWQDVSSSPTAQYIVPSPVMGRKFYRARSY